MDGSGSDVTADFHAGNASNSLMKTYTDEPFHQKTVIQQTLKL